MINKMQNKKLIISILMILNLVIFTISVSAQSNEIYILTLNYKKVFFVDSLSLVSIIKTTGSVPDYKLDSDVVYKLEVVSANNEILKSMQFSAPSGSDVNFIISVPYFENGKVINIYDKGNNKVLEIPLQFQQSTQSFELVPKGATASLAQESSPFKNLVTIKPEERISPATRQIPSAKNLNWLYIALPLLLIFGFLTYLEVNRKREHAELMQKIKQQNMLALKNYVMTNLRRGYNKEQIRNALIKNNYNNQEIEEAFRGLR